MKNVKCYFLIVTIAVLFNSCDKDAAIGPQGLPGTNGATGNSNVSTKIYLSDTLTRGNVSWSGTLIDSSITQAIVDSGVVLIYYKIPSTTLWYMMANPMGDAYFNYGLYQVNVTESYDAI